MPLDPREQRALTMRVSEVITNEFGYTGPGPTMKYSTNQESLGSVGSPVDAFMISAERLITQMAQVTELLAAFLDRALNDAPLPTPGAAEPDKPKGRGGRPRKDAAAQGNGAVQQPQQPQPPQQSEADKVFGQPQSGHDMFGDQQGGDQGDPFAVPDNPPQQPQQPQQPPMTDAQAKEHLRVYMQAWGTEGTMRLTELLTRVAGVKRFSDCPANKWPALVAAANQELAGRRA